MLNKYVGESEANIRLADIRVITNRPFPISPGPLYQNEVECSAFDVKLCYILMQMKLIFTRNDVQFASF